jgi:hypothetical protein
MVVKMTVILRGDLDLRYGGTLYASDVRDGEKSTFHTAGFESKNFCAKGMGPNRVPQPCVDEHGTELPSGSCVFFGRGGG